MSKLLPIKVPPKCRRIDWLNTVVHVHDLTCGCEKALEHTVQEIFLQEPSIKEKCLTTGENPSTGGEEDVLGDGDLDRLFAEEFGEEKDTTEPR